jgi:hypothetical protein
MKIVEYSINVGCYDPKRDDIKMADKRVQIFKNDARESRLIKMLAHRIYPDAEYSIYWDANKKGLGLSAEMIIERYLGKADICIQRNPRKLLADEFEAAVTRVNNPAEINIIELQRAAYLKAGFGNLPVYGYQPLIRRHNAKVNAFFEDWWCELCLYSYRDQLSFPVVLVRHPEIKVAEINLAELGYKLHAHGTRIFPKVSE